MAKDHVLPRETVLGTHEYGIRVFMHSCGFLDAGIDVFQFDQPALHDMQKLAYRELCDIAGVEPVTQKDELGYQERGLWTSLRLL